MIPRYLNIQWLLLGSLLVCSAIALNTGVDLLWAVVLFVLVAWVLAWLMPYLQLRGLEVKRVLPEEATVGQPARIVYELSCRHWYAGCGIELHDRLADNQLMIPVAYFGRVRDTRKLRLEWEPQVRGIRTFSHVWVESGFPWGLTTARRRISLPTQRLTIYPDAVSLERLPVEAGGANPAEMLVSTRRGGNDELYGLKGYQPGDDLRRVHWRSSARAGELLVREFEHQQDRQFWIMLDQSQSLHTGTGRVSTLEYMCRIAHSVMLRANAEGLPTGLCYWESGELQTLAPGTSYGAYLMAREALATVQLEEVPPLATWLRTGLENLPLGGTWLLFNLGGQGSREALLNIVRSKLANPLFIEFDHASFMSPADETVQGQVRETPGDYPLSHVAYGADLSRLFAGV